MHEREPKSPTDDSGRDDSRRRVIPVRQLLDAEGSVELEHRGEIYRLRITRNGKLILTK